MFFFLCSGNWAHRDLCGTHASDLTGTFFVSIISGRPRSSFTAMLARKSGDSVPPATASGLRELRIIGRAGDAASAVLKRDICCENGEVNRVHLDREPANLPVVALPRKARPSEA